MAHVEEHRPIALESPVLVEGLPGVGLVGKIAADHLVQQMQQAEEESTRAEPLGMYQ